MDFGYTEEQEKLRKEAREFFLDEMPKDFEPGVETMFSMTKEQTDFWMEFQKKAGEKGYLTPGWSEETGGLGLSPIEQGIVEEEWGYTGGRFPNFSGLHIAGPAVQIFGTEEQKKEYLPLFCDAAFEPATAALIEPRYDFDPNELATTATLDRDEYVLNGQKCYVPLAANANRLLVWAAENGATQSFIVPKGTPGLEIGEREKNMGIKALSTYELTLNDCRVPKSNKLGGEAGCDFNRILNYSRVALAAMAVGVANAAYEYAREYAKEREAFGEPIASRQAIAFMLAEMAIEADATRLMAWEAAWKLDRGEDATKECYLAKSYADDMVLTVTDRAVQVLGGHGYIREHPVELWLRNGRGFATFDGMAMV